ncbi:MAG TPA: GatB/YqeY domain-containing protein [Actinomycetota bacterium]|nr:GatB/YqeY domain-containing protein [Actinomycetota bacterium]
MAGLKDRIREDLTAAMRAKDEVAKSTLRSVLTAISKAEVSGKAQTTLSDDQVIGVIRSELGKRKEAAEIYAQAGRDELASRENAEAEVLAPYLPAEMGAEELSAIVAEEIDRVRGGGVEGPRAMGAVIKAVRERVGARAEGSRIAQAVKAGLGI